MVIPLEVLHALRQRNARPWMFLAAMVWLVANFVTQWHEIAVPHARCPEHGELLELVPGEQGDHPEIAAAPSDPHHDGCAYHTIGATGLPALRAPLAAPGPAPAQDVPALVSVCRAASSLRYAPKTSPPTV